MFRCSTSPTDRPRCEIYNSTLSEAGVMGFEYGYSRDYPEALVLWEAQFGDFANVAQAVIDQFIVCRRRQVGPALGPRAAAAHGYEGQGPEHSSARIERFLQLAARDNFQICQPSNAATVFPPAAASGFASLAQAARGVHAQEHVASSRRMVPIEDLTHSRFLPVVPDTEAIDVDRILRLHRQDRPRTAHGTQEDEKITNTAIIFLDRSIPSRKRSCRRNSTAIASAREIVWVQEEPANMGALFYMLPRLRHIAGERPVLSISVPPVPAPRPDQRKRTKSSKKPCWR